MTKRPEIHKGPCVALRRREWLLASLAFLSGCGGGVDSGGTGTGDQSTLAIGPITGFGSVVVNGIRFDETLALITDDDGNARRRDELRLGVRVEVLASPVVLQGGVAEARASVLRLRSELVGPIESVDLSAGRLVVLGQRVDLAATTVVEGGVAGLAAGQLVAVYATLDLATPRYVATRIEPVADAGTFKLCGVVSALDLGAMTLDIGAARLSWAGVAPADPVTALAPGRAVRVRLSTSPALGVWQAVSLQPDAQELADRDRAEIEGRISAFTSTASFAVDGIPVEAGLASFPEGSAGLGLGAKVEVEGRLQGGVLFARQVEVEDDDGDDESFELHGPIEAVDVANQQFEVRGITVSWTGATRFDSSTAADLAVGRLVDVRGRLSADGQRVEASLIHVEL